MLRYDWRRFSIETLDEEMRSFIAEIYRSQRYLQAIPDAALFTRLDGLVAKMVALDFYSVPNFITDNGKDTITLAELLEEFRIRNLDPQERIKTFVKRLLDAPRFANVERVLETLKYAEGSRCLFKFTKRCHVDSILRGEIRFTAASSCNADGLNGAIRDNELMIEHALLNLRMVTANGTTVPIKGGKVTRRAHSDYYVSCFSVCCEPKMFALFEYDACVLIKNADRFVDAVISKYQSLHPTFKIVFGSVEYIDPLKQLKATRPLEFLKTYEFAYQKEYRFVSFSLHENKCNDLVQTISIDMSNIECDLITV